MKDFNGRPLVTHCFELMETIYAKIIKANYTAEGYQAIIVDGFDQ